MQGDKSVARQDKIKNKSLQVVARGKTRVRFFGVFLPEIGALRSFICKAQKLLTDSCKRFSLGRGQASCCCAFFSKAGHFFFLFFFRKGRGNISRLWLNLHACPVFLLTYGSASRQRLYYRQVYFYNKILYAKIVSLLVLGQPIFITLTACTSLSTVCSLS